MAAANGTTQLGSTIIFILSYTNRSAFMISASDTNNIAEQSFEYNLEDLAFLKTINPYAIPKAIKVIEKFERNASDKIIRF
jgi:acyl-coenzyme A synthetase/AMP-(fatty) acid ligase